jgi:hypothetical protein
VPPGKRWKSATPDDREVSLEGYKQKINYLNSHLEHTGYVRLAVAEKRTA